MEPVPPIRQIAAAVSTCPKCHGETFSPKPAPSSSQNVPAGFLRCTDCQTIWHPEDLTGERFKFLRASYRVPAERIP